MAELVVDEEVARQVERGYRQGYSELDVHENGGACCHVCPHKPLFRDLSMLYLHANGNLPSSPERAAKSTTPEYPRPVSQHAGLVRYLYRLLRNSELKLPPPRFPGVSGKTMSRVGSRAEMTTATTEALGGGDSMFLNPPVVVLCNIKQETFGAVAPAQLPRANNAIRPMSPGTYSEQGLDVDASRADLKELLQAMEPSTRRCVTQAVRLASSGYVLLEFQRVSSDNIAGYVEANKLAQKFKKTGSGRVEWEQYRRSGSYEPEPHAFGYFALVEDLRRLDPKKENVEWEEASSSAFMQPMQPGTSSPRATQGDHPAAAAASGLGMGMGAAGMREPAWQPTGAKPRDATMSRDEAAAAAGGGGDGMGLDGINAMCTAAATPLSGFQGLGACCPALDFPLVGGLELLSTAGSETERLLGTLEEALPDLDPMPGLNGAAQTLQGMGEHVGSELFGLGKTLGEELRGTDEPWETMIASMMMNGTGASDVISSSLSAAPSGGNLTPATVA